jgi:metallophosphoesterase (TIGR00282 family)
MWRGQVNGIGIAVINLIGRVFMPPSNDPFAAANDLISSLPKEVNVRLVDIHAEATSEKAAMAWFLDGRVSAVVGTHTHVQTADERILEKGTAFISDLGMTGSYSGVIGMDRKDVIHRFTTAIPKRAEHSIGEVRICGAVIDIDETSGLARSIQRISLPHEQ